eukprot:jgi/Astpho2/1266/Aster-07111
MELGLSLTPCSMLQVLGIHGFAFPLLLTSCHMGFSFLALLPLMLREPYVSRHMPTLKQQWKGLVAIGLFLAANISLNNLSLVLITLSLNQVIRSAMPVAVAMLSAVIEHKIPTLTEVAALTVLSIGVMIAVWEGSVTGSVTGLILCIAALFSNAAMISTTGKVLSEKLDVLRLAFYTAPISCSVLLPLFIVREHGHFVVYQKGRGIQEVATILACSSAIALAYNVVHSMIIQRISSTGSAVLGEIKVLALLVASALLFGEVLASVR